MILGSGADDPRLKRVARNLAAAFLVSIFVFALSPLVSAGNAAVFAEIMHGFAELLPSISIGQESANQFISAGCRFGALMLFSFAAIWLFQRFAGPQRIVLLIQVAVLSLAYQLGCYYFFQVSGNPLSILIAILIASYAGVLIKARDYERRELEAKQIELRLRNDELQESRLALVKQDESERRLLAADLHDQVLNDLRSIQKKFEEYSSKPEDESRDFINSMLKQTMSEIREIMDELCPVLLEEFGLAAAIEDRLDKAAKQAAFEVRFNQTVESEILDALSSVERQLIYRLVQESLNNINKHAEATLVRISLDRDDSNLLVRVSDNGKGIDPGRLSESSRGTLYMRLRAALIGAKVSWKQGPDGKGTTVEIRMHVQNPGS